MQLKPSLLDTPTETIEAPTDLKACLNAHGLYNSVQCVLRLSPEVHRKIDALPKGITEGYADFDGLRAYSTYLHETIHWWQHSGSTLGLLLSLSYPGQAHANHNYLKELLGKIGPKKSLRRFVEAWDAPGGPETPHGLANVVVNNHFDIEFFRILITRPDMIRQVVEHPFFDCIGHSYRITYGNIALILASSCDKDLKYIPDPRNWSDVFRKLREEKEDGYYYGSPVGIVPVGAHHIFEGQARFGQLQFLYFISGRKLAWDDVRAMGMLDGVYGEAFNHFLRLAELDWPASIDDPVVGLFLLLCDIAINPSAGFPMPLIVPSTFITDVDPGFRFFFLCRMVATKRPDVARMIRNYTRDEYIEASEALCGPMLVDPPLAVAEKICGWARDSKELKALMEEHKRFDYAPYNLPVRMLFAHFIDFCQDKLERPEFFCWPGAWKTGNRVTPEIAELFEKRSAPFLDKPDDGGIYPRVMSGKDESVVQKSFDTFYAMNVTYDLTRQWIAMPGKFEYDYRWLSSTGTPEVMKNFADVHFEQIFGAHPDKFEILE
ncbi:MAG: hypothetical protein ABL967_07205 [Bryobacteraceae bacterium]